MSILGSTTIMGGLSVSQKSRFNDDVRFTLQGATGLSFIRPGYTEKYTVNMAFGTLLFRGETNSGISMGDDGSLGLGPGQQAPNNGEIDIAGNVNILSSYNLDVGGTISGNGSGITNVNAETLDNLNSTDFIRSNTADTVTGNLTLNNQLFSRYGINGGYGDNTGSGTDWGASVWGMGDSFNGTGYGSSFSIAANHYGLVWLRGAHPSANSTADEGLYLYRGGTQYAALGFNHSVFNTEVTADDVTATSDRRLKESIRSLGNVSDSLRTIEGVYYNRKDDEHKTPRIGVIAQEVEMVFPELVSEVYDSEKEEYFKTVNYPKLTAVLLQAINNQRDEIDDLTYRIQKLEWWS